MGSVRERFARELWATPRTVAFAGLCGLAMTVGTLAFLLATANGVLDIMGRPLGTDFSSFWSAGRLALGGDPRDAYDWEALRGVQTGQIGTDLFFPWSYPPIFLALAAALALLPYLPALALWQGATLLAAAGVFRAILPGRTALLAGLGAPVVFVCLAHGQTDFLTSALLAGGVLALGRSEIGAGILFGLLAFKPQLGLLIPIALAAGGHWRAFQAAAATVLALVGATVLLWGWPVWQAFLDSTAVTRTVVMESGASGFEKFQSLYAWIRLAGGGDGLAYTAQALVSGAVALACVWAWRREVDRRLKGAVLLAGTLLISPYVLDYSFVMLGFAAAFFAAVGLERGFRPGERTCLALVWIVPGCARSIAGATLVPAGLMIATGFFLLTLARIRREGWTPSVASGAPPDSAPAVAH